jgi:methionyl-tRNA formyltransferase
VTKKLTLYLLGKKGYECLKALKEPEHRAIIRKIIVGRDKFIDNDYSYEIIKYAKRHNISIHEKNENFSADEFSVAIGWKWIIDEKKTKLLIFHDSLLPKYRGFAPVVNCLINGEETIGVSVIWGTANYDRGNIIFQEYIDIQYPIKIEKAIELTTELYIKFLKSVFRSLVRNQELSQGVRQDESLATYSLWRDEKDYFINWNQSATQISRFIDAVGCPYGGAKSYLNDEVVVINKATPIEDVNIENRDIGKVIFNDNGYPTIVCQQGLLKIYSITNLRREELLPLRTFRSQFK